MTRPQASEALNHLRVLDLTRVRAGPTCCRVLADFGADVIKIEAPPGVDPNESISGARHGYDMLNLHRNKRSLTLNLKKPEGLAVFKRMVETADVVVENYRPDVKARLGIDYEVLKEINPRIIMASISGFGQDGPYHKRAGFDQIAQGMGGLMWVTGRPGEGPMRAGTAVADSTAGLYAATGIMIALAERERSGEGQWLHTSLLQAQIALMDFQAARYLVDREVPAQAGNDHPYATPMGMVETKDGFINIGVGGDGQWRSLCGALGLDDLAEDPDFATIDQRYKNRRPQVWARLQPIFASEPSAHWLGVLEEAGVPAGPVYKVDEMFDDPQVRHLGIAQPVHHPERGDIELIGQPVVLTRTPASVATASPDPGDHTDEVLAEIGLSTSRKSRRSKRPRYGLSEARHVAAMAAVDRDDGAAHEAGPVGRHEDHDVGDFFHRRRAAVGQVLEILPPALCIAELRLGARPHQVDQPLGLDRAGTDRQHPHAAGKAAPADRLGEGVEPGIARGAGDIAGVSSVGGKPGHVDDDAAPALRHGGEKRAGHVDIAEDLEIPGLAPALFGHLMNVAGGNGARVVDDDIGRADRLHQFRNVGAVGNVDGVKVDAFALGARDLRRGGFQILKAARHHMHDAALRMQGGGNALADAGRGAGDQGGFSGEVQVHAAE